MTKEQSWQSQLSLAKSLLDEQSFNELREAWLQHSPDTPPIISMGGWFLFFLDFD